MNHNGDDFSRIYGHIEEAIKALTKDDLVHPYKIDRNFTSSNDGNDVGYIKFSFDRRYQKNFTAAQPNNTELEFDGVILARINGYLLALTDKLICFSSDRQRSFDLTGCLRSFAPVSI